MFLFLLSLLFACGTNDSEDAYTCETDDGSAVDESVLEEQYKTCWQGDIIEHIYESVGALVMGMYEKLTQGAMALMMVSFAIWMAFQLLKHVSSFTEESPGEIWTEIIKKFFICFVCGVLAGSPQMVLFVLNSVIFPVYNAFLELGSAVIGNMSETLQTGDSTCKVSDTLEKATLQGFPRAPSVMMRCLTCTISEKMNFGIGLAWTAIKQKGAMAALSGIIMMFCFLFVKLGFVFYLVDTIFRFAMMVMLLPLLIMSYAFAVTKKCVKVGFLTILNSSALLMMIAIVMMVILAATNQLLNEFSASFADTESLTDFSVPLIVILLLAFLTLKSVSIAKEICDTLVGGGGKDHFQRKIGRLAAFIGGSIFKGFAKGLWDWARGHSSKLQGIHDGVTRFQDKLNVLSGRKNKLQ